MYLVFDIGATHTRLAVSHTGNTLDAVDTFDTGKDFEEGVHTFLQHAKTLLGASVPIACAGGVAGVLNAQKTALSHSPNLPDWNNKPLKQKLEASLVSPVLLENDAALAGLGEAVFGAGKNLAIVGYCTVSTGVGGARIVKESIDSSAYGFEMGHQIIQVGGHRCQCGGFGHLEAYVSGTAIEKLYHKQPALIDDRAAWDTITKHLAVGLHNTIVHWSPHVMVLGGGVIQKIQLEEVSKYLKNSMTIFANLPLLRKAQLGDQSALFGSLAYGKTHRTYV